MRKLFPTGIILIVSLLLAGCKSYDHITKNPRKDNPVDKIGWLKEITEELKDRDSSVTLWELDGKTYYGVNVKGPEKSYDMDRTTIYAADGSVYLVYGGLMAPPLREKANAFKNKAVYRGVIWESNPPRK